MNLNQLLHLTRPLVVFDVETTGTADDSRIVELGFQQWKPDVAEPKEWRTLINPEMPIPAEVTAIHGISDETIRNCAVCAQPRELHEGHALDHEFKIWPTFKQLAPHLIRVFTECDFAGKHVRFDLGKFAFEMNRAGLQWTYHGARIVDAERLEQIGDPRTLSDLYRKHTGEKLEGAHQALRDVQATTTVIVAQLQKYANIPRDLDLLHKLQWPEVWLDSAGRFKMIRGVPTCAFGKHRGKAMQNIPNEYYAWIVTKSDMAADVKALASQAMLGNFPK